jgi:hypothetical protein
MEILAFFALNTIGVAVMCGIYRKTVDVNTRDIEKVKGDVEVHDREIGSVYGRLHMGREVRR